MKRLSLYVGMVGLEKGGLDNMKGSEFSLQSNKRKVIKREDQNLAKPIIIQVLMRNSVNHFHEKANLEC